MPIKIVERRKRKTVLETMLFRYVNKIWNSFTLEFRYYFRMDSKRKFTERELQDITDHSSDLLDNEMDLFHDNDHIWLRWK